MDKLREFLIEKQRAGVKAVQVSTALKLLDEASKNGRQAKIPRLFGTLEAAEYLGVERPRIGKWLKMGVMPKPVADLKGTPVWTLKQLQSMRKERERRRRRRTPVEG